MEDKEVIEGIEIENEKIEQQEQHVETDIEKELAECREAKKAIEIKYQAALKELTSTNQARVERNVFNSGNEEILRRLRETIETQSAYISKLKDHDERQKSDIEMWRNKCHESEKQQSKLFCDLKKASMKTSCLEAENRGLRDKIKHKMNQQSMNMSSASSIMSNLIPPPPPPVDVPSIDEFLKMSAEQNSYNMISNSSIPPPPPVDTPISDLIQQSLSGNRSVNSSYG